MSVGFFFGIRHSYVPEAQDHARRLLDAVNAVLAHHRLAPIADPESDPVPRGEAGALGRSSLDHHGSRALRRLGELAGESRPHLQLLDENPYRVVYVPRLLRRPAATSHHEEGIWEHPVAINVGSSTLLLDELLDMAKSLGIPLSNGKLLDLVAGTIDEMEPLNEGETDVTLIEDLRTAWLLLHEAARFSIELDVPLTLAG